MYFAIGRFWNRSFCSEIAGRYGRLFCEERHFFIFVLKYGIDGRTWKLVRVGSFWFCCLVKLGVTGQEEKRRKLRKILYSTHKNTVLFL